LSAAPPSRWRRKTRDHSTVFSASNRRVYRRTEPKLGGFAVLRPHVQATFAATGEERLRPAAQQTAKLWAKVAAAM